MESKEVVASPEATYKNCLDSRGHFQCSEAATSGHFRLRLIFGFGEVATSHDFRTGPQAWSLATGSEVP